MYESITHVPPSLIASVGVVDERAVEGCRRVGCDRFSHVVSIIDEDTDLKG